MIISLPDEENCFIGWVEFKNGYHSFSVSVVTEIGSRYGLVDLSSLVVDDELGAFLHPIANKAWFKDKLESFKSVKALASGIQNFVNQIGTETPRQVLSSSSESALLQLLMRHLDDVGWNRVLKVNEDFSVLQMRSVDQGGREHHFDILINPGYPLISPTVQATLPNQIKLPWTPNSDLRSIVSVVDSEIKKHQDLFQELSEIDTLTWVLEPVQPNFSTSTRRLALERSCSIVLDVNIDNPREICPMNFFGPPVRVNHFRASLNKNAHLWSNRRSLKCNIEALLESPLPTRTMENGASNYLSEECGICYAYAIPSDKADQPILSRGAEFPSSNNQPSNSSKTKHAISVPDQACANTRCCKIYHFSCLVDWLQALPSSKTSFGTLFGSCPYCQEALSVRIQR